MNIFWQEKWIEQKRVRATWDEAHRICRYIRKRWPTAKRDADNVFQKLEWHHIRSWLNLERFSRAYLALKGHSYRNRRIDLS